MYVCISPDLPRVSTGEIGERKDGARPVAPTSALSLVRRAGPTTLCSLWRVLWSWSSCSGLGLPALVLVFLRCSALRCSVQSLHCRLHRLLQFTAAANDHRPASSDTVANSLFFLLADIPPLPHTSSVTPLPPSRLPCKVLPSSSPPPTPLPLPLRLRLLLSSSPSRVSPPGFRPSAICCRLRFSPHLSSPSRQNQPSIHSPSRSVWFRPRHLQSSPPPPESSREKGQK